MSPRPSRLSSSKNQPSAHGDVEKKPVTIPKYFPYSDVLFDYASFLRSVDTNGKIANDRSGKKVAIIGKGASAITAAYELLRCGSDVTLIAPEQTEENDTSIRVGRCYSHRFATDIPNIRAEMGAMRFPPSQVAFFHYIHKLNIEYTDDFPDPGYVKTMLHVRGKNYFWEAHTPPPGMFLKIFNGWSAMVSKGFTLADGTVLEAPDTIADYLQSGQLEQAKNSWQTWINAFEAYSFRSALTLIFQQKNVANIPNNIAWSDQDIELFGTLGIGSGGFAPIFNISFMEMARLLVNHLEVQQLLLPKGPANVFATLADTDIAGKSVNKVHKIGYVTNISYNVENSDKIDVKLESSEVLTFDSVISTIPSWENQISLNITDDTHDTKPLLRERVRTSLKHQHVVSSYKIFMLTKDKFWLKNDLPANIQSDTLARGLYCLDYEPDDPDGYGLILLSYSWQDDSQKQLAIGKNITKETRAKRLIADIAMMDLEFASHLIPLYDDYETYVTEIEWMHEADSRGAFKLPLPGHDTYVSYIFTDFQKAGTDMDSGLYIAGDGISFYGGWIEGALQSALNAACAVLKRFEATDIVENNPLTGVRTKEYDYTTECKE